jgi:tol-pal system protein YbgF
MAGTRVRTALPSTLVLAGIVLGGCAALPPQEDPVQLRLTDMEARLIRVERMLDSGNIAALAEQVDSLQREAQQLRGEIETLQFEQEQAQLRQRQQYIDLDDRVQAIEERSRQQPSAAPSSDSSAGSTGTLAPGQLPVPGAGDRSNYQAAFELLKEGRWEEAANGFRQFLLSFPDSPLGDNAQYWLAETDYVNRRFRQALPQFQRVLDEYPASRKYADALLKIGYTNYELQNWAAAREALQRVVDEFGETTAARLAQQRLERMRAEGR